MQDQPNRMVIYVVVLTPLKPARSGKKQKPIQGNKAIENPVHFSLPW